jgi:hypothetical protein
MSNFDTIEKGVRAALCSYCKHRMPLADHNPGWHTDTRGCIRWCSVPADVVSLLAELDRLRAIEVAARELMVDTAYIHGQGAYWVCSGCDAQVERDKALIGMGHNEGCVAAALLKALGEDN